MTPKMGLGWAEQTAFNPPEGWGSTAQKGVQLEDAFQQAILAALDKSTAVEIRVWLGDTSGGFGEWRVNGDDGPFKPLRGEEFGQIIDTRGLPADIPIDPSLGLSIRGNGPSNVVPDDQINNHVGFGPYFGILFIDDVVVENDEQPIPVELSGFTLE